MTMDKALYPRDDIGRLYMTRKEGRRGIDTTKDCVDASIQRIEDNIEKRKGILIRVTRNKENKNHKTLSKKINLFWWQQKTMP